MYRVIWQHGGAQIGDLHSEELATVSSLVDRNASVFKDILYLAEPTAVFSGPKVTLRANVLAATPAVEGEPIYDLAGYHHAFVADRGEAQRLCDRLRNTTGVLYADLQARLSPPRWFDENKAKDRTLSMSAAVLSQSPTPDLTEYQGYLTKAPHGIDSGFASQVRGGDGEGVSVIDIEWGWNFQHEDLREVKRGVIFGPNNNDDHGTAVLGIYSGDANEVGIEGIAPGALAMAASTQFGWATDPITGLPIGKWNAADAIYMAAEYLKPGNIILLEMHGPGPNTTDPDDYSSQQGYVPVEYWQSEFAAIHYAVSKGIYVIEAAGNGGESLDDQTYGSLFDQSKRDSGAVLVGGGASPTNARPRSRMSWSNFGSRLNLQGWGEDIATTGGHGLGYHNLRWDEDPSRCYTLSFGGTSGASPIVVGAVACVAGAVRAAEVAPLQPLEMIRLLSSTGTPQGGAKPEGEWIGPLPDLNRALREIGLA